MNKRLEAIELAEPYLLIWETPLLRNTISAARDYANKKIKWSDLLPLRNELFDAAWSLPTPYSTVSLIILCTTNQSETDALRGVTGYVLGNPIESVAARFEKIAENHAETT
jgi:hypothetical protein